MSEDELEVHALTFDELVDRIREPLAELEAAADAGELDPIMVDFARGMRAALDRYDADAP